MPKGRTWVIAQKDKRDDMNSVLESLGARLARYLSMPRPMRSLAPSPSAQALRSTLQAGDVLLVEGHTRFSSAIKYLTQSTWSHSALFVGDYLPHNETNAGHCLIESDTTQGVRSIGVEAFKDLNVRICRPIGLTEAERKQVAEYAISRIGDQYDLSHVFDLVRYLLPTPPVTQRFRRRMLALGSGDPTRAICSSLVAQAFESIRYPILPIIEESSVESGACHGCVEEVLHVRHYSLYTPRDFDVSPYFQVIKPALPRNFDFHRLHWAESDEGGEEGVEEVRRVVI